METGQHDTESLQNYLQHVTEIRREANSFQLVPNIATMAATFGVFITCLPYVKDWNGDQQVGLLAGTYAALGVQGLRISANLMMMTLDSSWRSLRNNFSLTCSEPSLTLSRKIDLINLAIGATFSSAVGLAVSNDYGAERGQLVATVALASTCGPALVSMTAAQIIGAYKRRFSDQHGHVE